MPDFNNDPVISRDGEQIAVEGHSKGTGVLGESSTWWGVVGASSSEESGGGVLGEATGPGVAGVSKTWHGIYGETTSTTGGAAVHGLSKSSAPGIYGKGDVAGLFEGKVNVHGALDVSLFIQTPAINAKDGSFTGDVTAHAFHHSGADYAETFGSENDAEPGTVLVVHDDGLLARCSTEYDTRVTGVVSGAGGLSPGSVMHSPTNAEHQATVALAGQVYVKADASYGAISVGDLLTTSPTEGFAMRVEDPCRAVGAIIGKALSSMSSGTGLVRMLVLPC
ncbi:hypothetical protein [Streptomyces collinus]|uniref:hypothetical protein n=1 Tax=Streptomyces collinus TaxID=42684 RepID=UPI0011DDAB51|nr:hypothetical protein [Streptomyces collinus]